MLQNDLIDKVLSVRKYKKWSYQIARFVYKPMPGSGLKEPLIGCQAFTWPEGYYIGGTKLAYRLCAKRGIRPQPIEKPNTNTKAQTAKNLLDGRQLNICSIGFSEKEQKWYGWSHRALYGFGIGSTVKLGDCAYLPSNKEEFIRSLESWYADDMYKNVKMQEAIKNGQKGIAITYDIITKEGKKIHSSSQFDPYLKKLGRGEWTSKTLEDAKQMAIDFANGVS